MLAIEVDLLTGRYYASRYNDRTRPEWPPHPARLFSALVATHSADPSRPKHERDALEWLERQPPPAIWATPAEQLAEREPHTVFVPVNDPTVVGVFDEEVAELASLRTDAQGNAKAEKALKKKETSLQSKIDKALAVGKVTTEGVKVARSVLPESRVRQPRAFPSARPEDPRVYFVWSEAPDSATREALAGLAARLVRLGHSASLVRARIVEAPPSAPNWRPDESGEVRLRVVGDGQLRALDEAFERHQELKPRILPAVFQPYTTRAAERATPAPTTVFGDDWIVLRRTGGPSLPSIAGPGVAKTIRKALMSLATQPPPPLLTGHGDDDGPARSPHLAIVPLPFVGHARADGSLLGVALVVPREVDRDQRRAVFQALAAWEARHRLDGDDAPSIPVHLGSVGEWYLTRLEGAAAQATLRPAIWCGPATTWASATPVALDKNPGELKDRDPAKAASAAAEAERIIRAACSHIGLPEPVEVTVLPHAALAGSAKAKRYAPFPEEQGRIRRVLTHVRLRFSEPVRGPILIGAGRYVGLGILRPVHDHE